MCAFARWACGQTGGFCKIAEMSASEILQKIDELPTKERQWLLQKLSETENIPESLRQSLAEAARGELIDLDDALQELDRR
jgi:hypothetical protein